MTTASYRVWEIDSRLTKSGWRYAPLGQLLSKSNESIEIDPARTYKEVTVRLWGQGVSLRGEKTGSEIGATKRTIVYKGQFIFSRIDARNGAFGLIPEDLEGAVVSNDFPVHGTKRDLLVPSYLGWMSRVPSFINACRAVSEGTTNRVRLKEDEFYRIEIPLPPLSEQRRTVAKIERIAAKIAEARAMRGKIHQETVALLESAGRSSLSSIHTEITQLKNWTDPQRNGIQTGPFGAQLGRNDFCKTGTPLLTIGNVQFNGLKTERLIHVSNEKAASLSRYAVRAGDILFARMGTVGRCCIVPPEADGWLINYSYHPPCS